MYRGRVCETGTPAALLTAPQHPYTRMLLDAVADQPELEPDAPVTATTPETGCVFASRCPHCLPSVCGTISPLLRPVTDSHQVACHLDLPSMGHPTVMLTQPAAL
jgi:oligopeptide/dipeptide ABC transporter ATP-binding protein